MYYGHSRKKTYPRIDQYGLSKSSKSHDVEGARLEALIRVLEKLVLAYIANTFWATRKNPGKVRSVDNTLTGQLSLSQKPAMLRRYVVAIEKGELKGAREKLAPLFKLMIQL